VQAASVFVWQTHASARRWPTSISRMSRVDDQSPSCSRTTRRGALLPTRLSPIGTAVTCGAIVSNLIDVVLAEGILRKPKSELPFKMPCGIEPMTPHGPPTKWLRRNRFSAVQTEGTLLHDAASHVGRLADQAKVSAGRQSHAN
jgi:hypothetical protein